MKPPHYESPSLTMSEIIGRRSSITIINTLEPVVFVVLEDDVEVATTPPNARAIAAERTTMVTTGAERGVTVRGAGCRDA